MTAGCAVRYREPRIASPGSIHRSAATDVVVGRRTPYLRAPYLCNGWADSGERTKGNLTRSHRVKNVVLWRSVESRGITWHALRRGSHLRNIGRFRIIIIRLWPISTPPPLLDHQGSSFGLRLPQKATSRLISNMRSLCCSGSRSSTTSARAVSWGRCGCL